MPGSKRSWTYEAIAGDEGLLDRNESTESNSNATALTFGDYLSRLVLMPRGWSATRRKRNRRALAVVGAYTHIRAVWGRSRIGSDNADFTVLDWLAKKTGGVRVSPHVPV